MLASFTMLVFLGLTAMTHEQNGQMQGGCPFSAFGASLCPQDILAVVLHQISSYQSILNIPTHFSGGISILSLLLFVLAVLVLIKVRPLGSPKVFVRARVVSPSVSSYRKITHWLSLFENSPSLY